MSSTTRDPPPADADAADGAGCDGAPEVAASSPDPASRAAALFDEEAPTKDMAKPAAFARPPAGSTPRTPPVGRVEASSDAPTSDMHRVLPAPTVPARASALAHELSERPATETVRRNSVRPAIVLPESALGSAPRPAPIPRELVEEPPALDPETLAIAIESMPPPPADTSTNPPPELPVVGKFGNYDLHGRLAFGGMAEIFLARENDEGAIRNVVIKRILPHVADDDQFVQMFLDEARLAIRLNHPSICHIYEFGRHEGSYFIAMEWVWGTTLGRIGKRAHEVGKVSVPCIVKIAATVAEALHYAHRARDERGHALRIVHRDVSPHNVMVSFDGVVKLLDFGVAKAAIHGTKTEAGVVKGKLAYMSPQQGTGQEVDGRADVFSLGICLYEALTGRLLYQRPTEYETVRAIITEPVPSMLHVRPDLPETLDRIVRKALAKAPEDRYRTAGEMQTALEQWLAGEGETVNTSRLAAWLDVLFHEEISRGPQVDGNVGSVLSRVQRRGARDALVAAPDADGDSGRPSVELTIEPAASADPRDGGLESAQPKASPSRWRWVAAALALLVCGLGAWGWLRGGTAAPRPSGQPAFQHAGRSAPGGARATVAQGAPAVAAAPDEVIVTLSRVPDGATVYVDNRPIAGRMPTIRRDDGVHLIEVWVGGAPVWRTAHRASTDGAYEVVVASAPAKRPAAETGTHHRHRGQPTPGNPASDSFRELDY